MILILEITKHSHLHINNLNMENFPLTIPVNSNEKRYLKSNPILKQVSFNGRHSFNMFLKHIRRHLSDYICVEHDKFINFVVSNLYIEIPDDFVSETIDVINCVVDDIFFKKDIIDNEILMYMFRIDNVCLLDLLKIIRRYDCVLQNITIYIFNTMCAGHDMSKIVYYLSEINSYHLFKMIQSICEFIIYCDVNDKFTTHHRIMD